MLATRIRVAIVAVEIENGLGTERPVPDAQVEHLRWKCGSNKNKEKRSEVRWKSVRAEIILITSKQAHSTMTLLESSNIICSITTHHGHVTSANCVRRAAC